MVDDRWKRAGGFRCDPTSTIQRGTLNARVITLADEDTTGQGGAEGKEVIQRPQVGAAHHTHLRTGSGSDYEIGLAVAVGVLRPHAYPALGGRAQREEAVQFHEVGAAEDLDVRPSAGSRAGDEVRLTVAIDIAHRHEDAPGEAGVREGTPYLGTGQPVERL